jgi:hypothetical protein
MWEVFVALQYQILAVQQMRKDMQNVVKMGSGQKQWPKSRHWAAS